MTRKLIAKANPNRHGLVKLVSYTDTAFETEAEHETVFMVEMPWEERGDGQEFDTEAEARAFFDKEVARLAETPNHAAQAEYDAQWGTDNGYAPWDRREY